MLQQLVQAQVERTAQPSLNPEANAFVMRDANLIYGGHLRPAREAHAGRLGREDVADCSSRGFVHSQGDIWSGHVPEAAVLDVDFSNGIANPAKPLLRASSL